MADVDPRDGGDGASQAEAVVEQFEAMRREADSLWGKLTELDLERQEHELVLKTLQPLDAGRRCFRLVGGVLVERTVGEVCPAVERHKQALEQVIGNLGAQLEQKTQALKDFQTKHKIRVRGRSDEPSAGEASSGDAGAQGILVSGGEPLETVPE